MSNIGKIDRNLAVTGEIGGVQLRFLDVRSQPFDLYGLIPGETGDIFRRMPEAVAEQVNPGVAIIHNRASGGRVRFRTDSDCVAIRAVMPEKNLMTHMPFLGSDGFDLYVAEGQTVVYRGSFRPPVDHKGSYEGIVHFDSRRERDVLIHFPLYSTVKDLFVGVNPDAALGHGGGYRLDKPVVYYGSSITQGGCASRPGNSYSNIISRNLNIDHINLGFSGNARGEEIMADYIANLPMAAFVLDYDHNAPDPEHLRKTHEPFFLRIREKNPQLPILMVTRTDLPMLDAQREDTRLRREIIRTTYENARNRGDQKVWFLDGGEIFAQAEALGIPADSCTVDGCHPNDLGFACMAKAFGDMLEIMLRGE